MVSFRINKQAGTPGARSPRRRVLIEGMFQTMSSTDKVAIRNISCTGAAIVGPLRVKVGAEGVLQVGDVDCLCRVVRSQGDVHGLVFDRPLPNQVVLDLHRVTHEDVKQAEVQAAKEWFTGHAR